MIRLCLAVMLCLSALAAAPVPRDARVPFGAHGTLPRADLERVKFDSQLVLNEDGKPRDDDEERDERNPDAPLKANRYDVAVHLPWAKFRTGEPMPVYLVLRNNRDETLGLHSRIDLSGGEVDIHGGGISFDVRSRATGKSVLQHTRGSTNCGGGSLVDVPPQGFYCAAGDLNQLCRGLLEPGEYEVDWRCGRFRAAAVRFTVLRSDAKPLAPKKPTHLHFYHLMSDTGEGDGRQLKRIGEPFCWNNVRIDSVRVESLAAALAVGQLGPYVPDVRAIPTADGLIDAWVVWKPYRDGDRIAVTLRARPPHTDVRFDQIPQLFLQAETSSETGRERWNEPANAKQFERDRGGLTTPLTIEVRLPDGWRERLGDSDTARVSVLIASKEIEFPRGTASHAEKREEQKDQLVGPASDAERPPVWSGVVRTDAIELVLPPRFPAGTRP